MKAVLLVALAAVVCCCVQTSGAARILALFPMAGKSHWIVFREMLVELGRRGHNLTVLTPFEEHHKNWELLKLNPDPKNFKGFNFLQFGSLPSFTQILLMLFGLPDDARETMKDKATQSLINSQDREFDLIIMEVFFQDYLMAFAHKFNVPLIGACALGGGSTWMNYMVGNPYPLSYIPETVVPYTNKMNLLQRVYNCFSAMIYGLYRQFFSLPALDNVIQEYFKDPTMPPLAEMERNISLLLLNTHFSFDYVRPLVPNAVPVAGMHITPPKKLPQDLQTFMDAATDGVIYFSLGSNMKSDDLPDEMKNAFLSVFSKLKQKVLWKLEAESLPNQPSNVKIAKWFPQNDLLAHKNIKFFITHGGVMSLLEALYFGVPLLGFPIFGDQKPNLLKAQDSGYGLMLELSNITEESFGWAVNELLTKPRYTENAKKYSKLFHDRPEKPLDTAIYWIEYVLRHRGARHMRSAALDLAWYQYLLLDVVLFVLLGALAAVAALVITAKAITRTVFRSSDSSSKKKTKSVKRD